MKASNIRIKLMVALFIVTSSVQIIGVAATSNPNASDNAIKVTFSDLDLSREEGVNTLYQRLKASARKVCGNPNGRELMAISQQRKQCYALALTKAVKKVGNESLEVLHSAGETS